MLNIKFFYNISLDDRVLRMEEKFKTYLSTEFCLSLIETYSFAVW